MGEPLAIIGAGGHARVVADIATLSDRFTIVGFIDEVEPGRRGAPFCGSTILGGLDQLPLLAASGVRFAFVAVGDGGARLRLAAVAQRSRFELPTLRHPSAVCARDCVIGDGTVLAAGSVVGAAAVIGAHAIINTSASVDHECVIEDGVHIGPGARLGGRVAVGRAAWLGIGAIVRDHIRVGAGALVGAGAVVVGDVPDDVVAYGNPARVVRGADNA